MLQELPEFLPEKRQGRNGRNQTAVFVISPATNATTIPISKQPHAGRGDAFELLTAGLGGGDIARHLGMTDVACEFLRVKVFQKMGAVSLIDLLVMAKIYALD